MKRVKTIPYQTVFLCPQVPWFCELEKRVEQLKRFLQSSSKNNHNHNHDGKYELEARIGKLEPATGQFVPGLLQKDGERLLAQVFPKEGAKWERLNDILYSGGVRRRGVLLIRKRTIYSATFICENGYAIRLSLASEEELPKNHQPGDEKLRRSRSRWSRPDNTGKWRYDFTYSYDTKLMEVEIEAIAPSPQRVWELAYRVAHLSAAVSSAATPQQLSEKINWPLRCYSLP